MDKEKIGKSIQKNRELAGMSQERLAEEIGLSSNFISCVERGQKTPSLDNFVKIANAIKVSADILLAEVLEYKAEQQATPYLNEIEKLPIKERRRVTAVLKAMLDEY